MTTEEKLKIAFRYALSWQMRNSGGFCGQAITGYTCLRCDSEEAHANSNTPVFCTKCSKEIKDEALKERTRMTLVEIV